MVAISITNTRAYDALTRVRELVEQCGTDEQKERLDRIVGGAVPAPRNRPIEHATYQAESLAILFEMVGPLVEASKPRRRGRPPKSKAATSKEN